MKSIRDRRNRHEEGTRPKVVTAAAAAESALPPQIQEALGELVGAAREGLLALSVGVGLGVVHELMELEVDEVVGPKGRHDPARTAKRHGHEDGSMTLGGRRVRVRRPRVRSADDERELPVETYAYFADRDPLTRAVMDRMLAGVSARRFARVGEPVGGEVEQSSTTTSKSSVSEMFVERTATALEELMSRRLDDVRLAVMMLDGLDVAERTHVVALGITTDGVKIPLGLWEGSTENATLARTLLADLVDRGLDPEQAILFVIDGSKALRRAIKDVFGEHALVHRCHRHKEHNVTDLLPERDRDAVRVRMRAAWSLTDPELVKARRSSPDLLTEIPHPAGRWERCCRLSGDRRSERPEPSIGQIRRFSPSVVRFRRVERRSAGLRGSGATQCLAVSAAWRPARRPSTRSWWRRIR